MTDRDRDNGRQMDIQMEKMPGRLQDEWTHEQPNRQREKYRHGQISRWIDRWKNDLTGSLLIAQADGQTRETLMKGKALYC